MNWLNGILVFLISYVKEVRLFLEVLAWPVVVLTMPFILRKEIRILVDKLESANLFGKTKLTFGGESDKRENDLVIPSRNASIGSKEKVGDLYWLGSDMMNVQFDATGRNRSRIIHSLDQCIHHLSQLDLSHDVYMKRLESLRDKVLEANESDLTAANRKLLNNDIASIRKELGHYIASCQKGFSSKPESKQNPTS